MATNIYFVNNEGEGFARRTEIPSNTTVRQFFGLKFPEKAATDYQIRVNGRTANADQTLQENDQVSIIPNKQVGACSKCSGSKSTRKGGKGGKKSR